ncbi:MAG: 23S rRNA (guanosine(2251)-2'-O)-methyltransferase RlmB [Bacteroidetes bacterium]|jgi:23S rRNA (guanosine2251-2'-O)-methyltransferase|nr:23S rRNA (guanosine(2251)-2'-O)-methyltransferase RlmB [Bacteroidota bacterium]
MSKDLLIGVHPIEEALNAHKDIDRVLVRRGLNSPAWPELKARLQNNQVPIQQVPVEKLDSLARGKPHQGVVGFAAAIQYQQLEDLVPFLYEQGKVPLFLLLDGVTDVRNVGAMARTAEGLGAHALILPRHGAARLGEDAIRASAGALHHLPVCRPDNLLAAADYLRASGIQLVAATEKAWKTAPQADMTGPTCLCMGAEGAGLRADLLARTDDQVSISLRGRVESLNVGIAAGILLYVVDMQRQLAAEQE